MHVTSGNGETLPREHIARAQGALERAEATCRHLGIGVDAAELVPKSPESRAANALRLVAEVLAELPEGAPVPAVARCSRNAAAAAAVVAQLAHREGDERSGAALQAALDSSKAAMAAAGKQGADAALNAQANAAELAAMEAARRAGWAE